MSWSARTGSTRLANPKSITFTWPCVNITLEGFKSRCTKPLPCASSNASATSPEIRKASGRGKLPERNLA